MASDSLFVFHYSSSLPEIRDPDGRVFTRVRSDEHRLFIGPFDRLGIHKIIQGQDTTKFAVNLAAKGMEPGSQNEDSRSEMLKALDPFKLRVQVHSAMESGTLQAGIQPLWSLLFLASILLLFVEAWVASVFSLKRTRI